MTSILDTNIWLLATAENREESELDKQAVKNHGDTDKIRGAIFMALIEGDTIVPKTVVEELGNFQKSAKAKKHNEENIGRLIYIFRNRAMEVIPTREDLLRQSAIIDALAAERETSQGFHTHSKLTQDTLAKIQSAANTAKRSQENEEPEGAWATLAREIEQLKAQRETATDTKALNNKIASKTSQLEKTKPFLLPDYEILLCAERTDAQIVTLDNDLQAMWAISPSLRKIKEPRLAIFRASLEKTFNQLEPKIRGKTKDMGFAPSL